MQVVKYVQVVMYMQVVVSSTYRLQVHADGKADDGGTGSVEYMRIVKHKYILKSMQAVVHCTHWW